MKQEKFDTKSTPFELAQDPTAGRQLNLYVPYPELSFYRLLAVLEDRCANLPVEKLVLIEKLIENLYQAYQSRVNVEGFELTFFSVLVQHMGVVRIMESYDLVKTYFLRLLKEKAKLEQQLIEEEIQKRFRAETEAAQRKAASKSNSTNATVGEESIVRDAAAIRERILKEVSEDEFRTTNSDLDSSECHTKLPHRDIIDETVAQVLNLRRKRREESLSSDSSDSGFPSIEVFKPRKTAEYHETLEKWGKQLLSPLAFNGVSLCATFQTPFSIHFTDVRYNQTSETFALTGLISWKLPERINLYKGKGTYNPKTGMFFLDPESGLWDQTPVYGRVSFRPLVLEGQVGHSKCDKFIVGEVGKGLKVTRAMEIEKFAGDEINLGMGSGAESAGVRGDAENTDGNVKSFILGSEKRNGGDDMDEDEGEGGKYGVNIDADSEDIDKYQKSLALRLRVIKSLFLEYSLKGSKKLENIDA